MENKYLTLILTRRCKENCRFCFVEKGNVSLEESAARKAVDFFIERPGSEKIIKFFGGEPLLEFGLLKSIVSFCNERTDNRTKRVNFTISSTGILLNDHILDFVRKHEIELVLDSLHIGRIRSDILKRALSLPFLTLTVNVVPGRARALFSQFRKFYQQGFRRFNILPAYYVDWRSPDIAALGRGLSRIGSFYHQHPGIFFKNTELKGNVPLFNTCLTCDVTGEFFSSNIVIFKPFVKFRKEFLLGDVRRPPAAGQFSVSFEKLNAVIKKAFGGKKLQDTVRVDRALSSFVGSLDSPIKRADVKVGETCNNSCKFCVRVKTPGRIAHKTTAQVKRDMHIAREHCQGIVLTGGEITIRSDFLELLSYARRLGYQKIQAQSNGRMFAYNDLCRKAIEAGANEFGLALHGHTPDLHDYLTSSPGSFYQTVSGIRNLKKLGRPVITNTVIVKANYRFLPDIAGLLVSLGVDQFQFAFVHALGSAWDNFESVIPRFPMIMTYVRQGLDVGIRAGVRVMTEAIPYCFMDGYTDHIAEKIIPPTRIFEMSGRALDFEKLRPQMAKAKGESCRRCRYFGVCEGTWKEYPARFGWSEFVPVK